MQYAKVHGAQTSLLSPYIVSIETDLSRGLHSFTVVGLPDKAVEESRDRVAAAIKHAGFESPKSRNQKIVISLAPADIKKEGPSYDLPIAVGYLFETGQIKFDPSGRLIAGELSLDGRLKPTSGIMAMAILASNSNFKEIIV